MKKSALIIAAFLSCFTAHALVLYGGDNSANTEAPSNGLPFSNVFQVYGNGTLTGSAVYLGNGYFATANHVFINNKTGSITSDGVNFYNISSYYTPTQVSNIDLKIFYVDDKSLTDTLTPVTLLTSSFTKQYSVTIVGGGVGRADSSEVGANPVSWGELSTADVRWGTNNIYGSGSATINGYTYNYYTTQLNASSGANEAGLTVYDSGSAMFYKDILGNWYLAGIATAVSASGQSSFEDTGIEADTNIYVDIAKYATVLGGMIEERPIIPESSVMGAAISIIAIITVFARRRRKNA